MWIIVIGIIIWALFAFGGKDSNTTFSSQKSKNVKGVLCLLIVWLHTSKSLAVPYPYLYIWVEDWGPLIVGAFFFLSGYGLCKRYLTYGGGIYLPGTKD